MSKLQETSKDLNEIEKKLKSLEIGWKELQGGMRRYYLETEGYEKAERADTSVKNKIAYIKQLMDAVKEFKTVMAGIGESGVGLDDLNRQIKDVKNNIDNLIKAASSQKNIIGNTSAILPSSFSSDLEARVLREIEDDFNNEILRDREELEDEIQKAWEEALKENEEYNKKFSRNIFKTISDTVSKITSLVSKTVGAIGNIIESVVDTVRNVMNKIKSIINGAFTIINKVKTGVTSILTLFGNFGNRVKDNNIFNSLSGSATELRSKLLLLKGAFDTVFNKDLINRGKELLSTLYSMTIIMGPQNAQDVLDWANSMERAFGLSASQLIRQLSEINGVLYGLGFKSKDIGIASENLLILGQHLASLGLAGGDTDLVMSKITSGLKGLTSSIDDLGLSVREAQMNTFLKDLKKQGGQFANISTDFSSLNEEARIYVRYAALIDQYTKKYDVTTLVDGLNTQTGAINLLNQSFNTMLNTLGSGLTQLYARFAGYLIPIIQLINQMITGLFNLIGIDVSLKLPSSSGLNNTSNGLDDLQESLDGVAESAAKASGNLQSFDRINNVTTPSSGSGSGGLGSTFDYTSLMTSMLDPLNDLADQVAESFADRMREKLETGLKDSWEKFNIWAIKRTHRFDFDLGFDFDKISSNLSSIKNNVSSTIRGWGNFAIGISLEIMDDLKVGRLITSFTTLINSATKLADTITRKLIPPFEKFYNKALSPIVKFIGDRLNNALLLVTKEFDTWSDWFDTHGDEILQFFEDLSDIVNAAWDVLQPYIDGFLDFIAGVFTGAGNSARDGLEKGMLGLNLNKADIIDWIKTELPKIIDDTKEKIDGFIETISNIASPLLDIVGDLGGAFLTWGSEEGIPWLTEKLKEFGDWLSTHKDAVVDLVERLATIAWDAFKTFVDLVGDLVDWCVDHPGVVEAFFKAFLIYNFASMFSPLIGGLTSVIGLIKDFTLLANGSKLKSAIDNLARMGSVNAGGAAAGAVTTAGGAAGGSAAGAAAGGAAAGGSVGLLGTIGGLAIPVTLFAGGIGGIVRLFTHEVPDAVQQATTEFARMRGEIALDNYQIEEYANKYIESYEKIFGSTEILDFQIEETLNSFRQKMIEAGVTDVELQKMYMTSLETILKSKLDVVDVIEDGIYKGAEAFGTYGNSITDTILAADYRIYSSADNIKNNIKTMAEKCGFDLDAMGLDLDQLVKDMEKTGFAYGAETMNIGDLVEEMSKRTQSHTGEIRGYYGLTVDSINDLKENTAFAVKAIGDDVKQMETDFNQSFDKMANNESVKKFPGLLESVAGGIGDVVSGIGNFLKSGWEKFTDFVTGNTSTKNNTQTQGSGLIPGFYADGGIINTPTLGVIGEAGPEAIIPLSGDRARSLSLYEETGRALGLASQQALNTIAVTRAASIYGDYSGMSGSYDLVKPAKYNAMYEAQYNALVEVVNKLRAVGGSLNNSGDTNININGFGFVDEAGARELARQLAPYNTAVNINHANNNF